MKFTASKKFTETLNRGGLQGVKNEYISTVEVDIYVAEYYGNGPRRYQRSRVWAGNVLVRTADCPATAPNAKFYRDMLREYAVAS